MCNTIFGCDNVVEGRIKDRLPSVICVKCSSNSIQLVACYACKQVPNKLEDQFRTVYSHCSMSAKWRSEFKLHQKFTDTLVLNVLAPCQTYTYHLFGCPLTDYYIIEMYLVETFREPQLRIWQGIARIPWVWQDMTGYKQDIRGYDRI